MFKITKIHWEAAKQVLHYLAGMKDIDLIYKEKLPNSNLHSYTDSNFAADEDNR
jgi:hypothetical protein